MSTAFRLSALINVRDLYKFMGITTMKSNNEPTVIDQSIKTEQDRLKSEQDRLRRIYEFLLSRTDLGTDSDSPTKKSKEVFNESFIAAQWGMGDYRMFIQRVLYASYPDLYKDKIEQKKIQSNDFPGLDLYKLVRILHSLDTYHSSERDEKYRGKKWDGVRTKFSVADKFEALRLFGELSSFERGHIKLPYSDADKLVVHLNTILHDPSLDISEDLIRLLYKITIDKSLEIVPPNQKLGNNTKDIFKSEDVEKLIKQEIKKLLSLHTFGISEEELIDNDDHPEIEQRYLVVKDELERMSFQSGSQQISNSHRKPSVALIVRLTRSIFENKLLTNKLPIYIKFVTVERIRPLPLRVHSDKNPDGLLDVNLSADEEIRGFSRQVALRVRVHFYIRSTDDNDEEIEFYQDIMGIGSPISLSIAAIDRVLLWDIPCLREKKIFPIAKQIFIKEEILENSNNSCIWSHSIVQLCNAENIESSLNNIDKNILGVHGTGNYCGFDLLETVVKSSLNARLDAIINLGINSKTYIKEIGKKIKELKITRDAKKNLTSYPFSFWAMEGTLSEKLLNKYRVFDDNKKIKDADNVNPWSLVAYDSHLSLAEVLLTEGKCCDAGVYLDIIKEHLNKVDNIIGDLMKARYYYLLAKYHYLYDLSNNNDLDSPIHHDRFSAIKSVRSALEKAYRHLDRQVQACNLIDELANTNTHPRFSLMGKLHFLESQLSLFFSEYTSNKISRAGNLKEVLINLQKARICAARDGDYDEYVCYSSFQSSLYSMMTYLDDDDFKSEYLSHLDKNKCLNWSHRLLENSRICYQETGRKSYNAIKRHAGKTRELYSNVKEKDSKKFRGFGKVDIEEILFMQEHEGDVETSVDLASSTMHIPFFSKTLIQYFNPHKAKVIQQESSCHDDDESKVYLFGAQSCTILFASSLESLTDIRNHNTLQECDEAIKKALRLSIASWSIAKSGGQSEEIDSNSREFKRDYKLAKFDEDKISIIKAFYPHRVNYIVAWTSLIIILCKILLLMKNYPDYLNRKTTWENLYKSYIEKVEKDLMNDIHEYHGKGVQKRFNGHLQVPLDKIIKYYKKILYSLEARNWDSNRLCLKDFSTAYSRWLDILMHDLLCLIIGEFVTVEDSVKKS
jgi:CRISPR/Cas system CSM-associated protein Csm2 small subunit